MMLLSVATLTLNPFILDYLSVARGYGTALGLLMAALYCIIAALDRSDWESGAKQLGLASFLLGLSAAANLAFLFPSVALASILTAGWMVDSEDHSVARKLGRAIETCWSPMIVTAFIVLVIPLSHSHRDDFVAGEDSIHAASVSVVQPSLFHRYDLAGFAPLGDNAAHVRDFISDWVVLIVLLTLTGWLARVLAIGLQTRRIRSLDPLDRVSLVVNATVLLSLAGVIAGHSIGGLRYPGGRTAIYFVPLIGLAWLSLAARLNGMKAVAVSLPAIAAVAAFLYGFTTQYYFEWRYDAGTARIFTLLREQGGHRPARLGVSWTLQATSNYYRKRYRLDWIDPVTDSRMDRGGFDFYILVLPDDQSTLDRVPLKILYRDPISAKSSAFRYPEVCEATHLRRRQFDPEIV